MSAFSPKKLAGVKLLTALAPLSWSEKLDVFHLKLLKTNQENCQENCISDFIIEHSFIVTITIYAGQVRSGEQFEH